MDDDDQDLARRLFVTATGRLENAHEVAAEGQGRLSAKDYMALAHRLQAAANEIITLAASIIVIADHCEAEGVEDVENQARNNWT